ncbi:MAG: hypothetical protein KDD60_11420, partial [Bdellovibrionales bacterium]|nr:hypothetical protein [Bdellovibrionales bacterium]
SREKTNNAASVKISNVVSVKINSVVSVKTSNVVSEKINSVVSAKTSNVAVKEKMRPVVDAMKMNTEEIVSVDERDGIIDDLDTQGFHGETLEYGILFHFLEMVG